MSARIERLVHVGNVLIDLVMNIPALPRAGGDVLATSSQVTPGGGYNVMVAASRQRLPVAYGGAHGSGPFGELARARLAEAGISILQEPTTGVDTGFDVALVDGSGERTFATSVGAEATLTYEQLAGIRVGATDAIYVSGYGLVFPANRAALGRWLGTLPDRATVVVDPGPLIADIPAAVLEPVLARTDWWSCNLHEARTMTGETDPERAATALAERTGRAGVVVRMGPDGCLLLTSDHGIRHIPAFEVAAIDSNGAGDAHVGVFVAALADGLPPAEAARRANAASAIAVTRHGPATAPGRDDLDRFLASAP
ncbi:PfkB family carbohydrate kinase [Actinoallomurus soli]|uniref:PfkB family carbohydrate kinase n=1 Tax=Actinoallomurus soli TaxID=2952535 RepID=UPI0020937D7B|nr:PfkB family carbohydrate kinase [Actinoallomurus soli]MCO5971596.1 PfkB family carbohydrate kinase [Actinoallomurus soli]